MLSAATPRLLWGPGSGGSGKSRVGSPGTVRRERFGARSGVGGDDHEASGRLIATAGGLWRIPGCHNFHRRN